jgi:O-antigen/teichoic acid export membrane protein
MLASKALVGAINVGASALVARTFGPTGQGTVAVALALTLILIQVGSVGVVTSNTALSARDSSAVPSLVANTIWVALSVGLVIIAVGAAAGALAPGLLPAIDGPQVAVVLATIPFALGAQLIRSILLGERRMVAYNAGELLLSVGTLVCVSIGIAVFEIGVTAAIVLLLVQYPVGFVLYSLLLWRRSGWSLRPDRELAREMVRLGLRVYPATVLAYLLVKVDLLLVDGFLGSTQAGYYSAALVVAQGLFLFPMVVGLNLFPRVAREKGTALTAKVFRTTAVLYGGACALVAALASTIVGVLFGSEFSEATGLLLWLLPGTFALGMVSVFSYHFAGHDYPAPLVFYWALGLALNLALNVALLPRYGTVIAPLASSVCYALVLVLHARLFVRAPGGWALLRPQLGEAVTTVGLAVRRLRP